MSLRRPPPPQMASIPGQKLLTALSLKVLYPLGIGQAARACHPVRAWAARRKGWLSRASETLLLLTVYATFVSTFAKVRRSGHARYGCSRNPHSLRCSPAGCISSHSTQGPNPRASAMRGRWQSGWSVGMSLSRRPCGMGTAVCSVPPASLPTLGRCPTPSIASRFGPFPTCIAHPSDPPFPVFAVAFEQILLPSRHGSAALPCIEHRSSSPHPRCRTRSQDAFSTLRYSRIASNSPLPISLRSSAIPSQASRAHPSALYPAGLRPSTRPVGHHLCHRGLSALRCAGWRVGAQWTIPLRHPHHGAPRRLSLHGNPGALSSERPPPRVRD